MPENKWPVSQTIINILISVNIVDSRPFASLDEEWMWVECTYGAVDTPGEQTFSFLIEAT
jgi:hypothetical protein